jgi:penicillin-insensitive murein endopeptidase
MLLGFGFAAGLAQADDALPSNDWSRIAHPTSGPPRSIGFFANGCIAGAVALPHDGPGYEVIRLSRNRYYGQPSTVAFVERLGRETQTAGYPPIYIGDMGQPRGGPLPFGHASHQDGLDVDIWFTADTKPNLPHAARESVPLPSMLGSNGTIDPTRFGPRQVALLRLSAADPDVERIFVSPAIKLALCRGAAGSLSGGSAWLHRLSPWWGHDDHFHVRLRCPADSPDCQAQPPVPPGDGCGAGLEHWAHHLKPPSVATTPAVKRLPKACQAVLDQP